MFVVDQLLLLGAVLILLGIASSKFSARMGMPVLVLFLVVGMLAGEDGIGGISFDNYALAHGIGTVSLAIILFDGGLRTSRRSFRAVFGPAITLATVGVVITSVVTGLFAAWLLELTALQGLLIGAIVGSTDAAAVFAVLRGRGVNLKKRLAATLEVESGSNDPMAIFLTVGILEIMLGEMTLGIGMLWFLLVQVAVGIGGGLLLGRLAVFTINRVNLDAAGLYPILTAAAGLLAYGASASLGGSGFLSVYLAGLIIGNERLVFRRGILVFHDGAAWLAQIAMFVMLGLLVTPSRLTGVALDGLVVAIILIFIARPLAVGVLLPWYGFRAREVLFVAWSGLKGAVPIILATYPLMLGVEGAGLLFHVVFFTVLVSAVLQGWTMPPLARLLRLQSEPPPQPPVSLEITSLRDIDGDIVEYTVARNTLAADRHVRDLRLPDGAVVAMIVRESEIIPPRGSTMVLPGDHLFLVMRPGLRSLVDRLFRPRREVHEVPAETEFPLRGDTTVAEMNEFYGVSLDEDPSATLHDVLLRRIGEDRLDEGSQLRLEHVDLVVRGMYEGTVDRVGLVIHQPQPDQRDGLAGSG
ncbi:MAG TPA: potassium/proton antiporter [Longimicrobiales bacterium]|nr:potassium/proton antiporter [Longimicrobiales bacterium]